jgi:peptidylprolyl isomerase
MVVTIIKVTDNTSVTIDANHPLAGKDLTFELELVKIL